MKAVPIVGRRIVDREGKLNLTGAQLLGQIVDNVVIVSPSGDQWKITVDDAGNLSTEAV